jgi:hypothetical protein
MTSTTQFQDFKTTILPTGTTLNPIGTTLNPTDTTTVPNGTTTRNPLEEEYATPLVNDEFRKEFSFHSKDNTEIENGFINVKDTKNHVPFSLFQVGENKKDFKGSLEGIIQSTVLSEVFFSRKNINNIQKNIIKKVLEGSKYKIGNQSEKELQIIMRSIYLQNALNNDTDIQLQIKNLNNLVYDYCVSNILVNATQYIGYLNKIDTVPEAIPCPINENIAGDKKCYVIPEGLF